MPLHKGEVYQIKHQRLILRDDELDLQIDEPFDPLLLPDHPLWGQEVAEGCFVGGGVKGREFYIEKDGKLHGQCRLYDEDKNVRGELYYFKGLLHGPATYFNAEGDVIASAWYVNGLQEGKAYWYYSKECIYSIQRFMHGLHEGKQEYFRADGTLKTLLTYQKGCLHQTTKL